MAGFTRKKVFHVLLGENLYGTLLKYLYQFSPRHSVILVGRHNKVHDLKWFIRYKQMCHNFHTFIRISRGQMRPAFDRMNLQRVKTFTFYSVTFRPIPMYTFGTDKMRGLRSGYKLTPFYFNYFCLTITQIFKSRE